MTRGKTLVEDEHMAGTHGVQTCRWGTPTIYLPWPFWFDAARHDWSCSRTLAPRPLLDSGVCHTCPNWEPANSAVRPLSTGGACPAP